MINIYRKDIQKGSNSGIKKENKSFFSLDHELKCSTKMNFELWDGGRCFYMKNDHISTLEVKKSASRDLKSLEKKTWTIHGPLFNPFLFIFF